MVPMAPVLALRTARQPPCTLIERYCGRRAPVTVWRWTCRTTHARCSVEQTGWAPAFCTGSFLPRGRKPQGRGRTIGRYFCT